MGQTFALDDKLPDEIANIGDDPKQPETVEPNDEELAPRARIDIPITTGDEPLPPGVSYLTKGVPTPVTQRGWWTPPFTSCMFAALSMLLENAGYSLPLQRQSQLNFVYQLHIASGRPLTSGSVMADSQKALQVLWADDVRKPPILFGTMTKDEVITALTEGTALRISGRPLSAFPTAWNLPAGYGDAGHAFGLTGTRMYNGKRQVWLVDVMFRPSTGYTGQWVPWDKLYSLIDKTSSGEVIVTWAKLSAALDTGKQQDPGPVITPTPPQTGEATVQLITAVNLKRTGQIPDGTPLYHPTTLAKVTATAGTGRFAVVGESEDGKWFFVRLTTGKLPAATQPVLLLCEKAQVSDLQPYVDPALAQMQKDLDAARTQRDAAQADAAKVRDFAHKSGADLSAL